MATRDYPSPSTHPIIPYTLGNIIQSKKKTTKKKHLISEHSSWPILCKQLLLRPIARIFKSGVTWMYVCMHKSTRVVVVVGGAWGMLPQEIRCSEFPSEAILGQKQCHRLVLTL